MTTPQKPETAQRQEMNADDVRMLDYFWHERGDFKRYTGYEAWAEKFPQQALHLTSLVDTRDFTEKLIGEYIKTLYRQTNEPESAES